MIGQDMASYLEWHTPAMLVALHAGPKFHQDIQGSYINVCLLDHDIGYDQCITLQNTGL